MWKTNDPIQELKRSHQFVIQGQENRQKGYLDWKSLQIHSHTKRASFNHTQMGSLIDDQEIKSTTDTRKEPEFVTKKNSRIIVKNGKITTEYQDKPKTIQMHEATQKKAAGHKRSDQKPSIQKLLEKMMEQDCEIEKLKEENRKLKVGNKKLELQIYQSVSSKSLLQTTISMSALSQTDRTMSNVPSIALMTSCTDLSQKSQPTQIQRLRSDIFRKDEQLKAKDKQNQHQKNLLYQSINTRLKTKQIQCYNTTKLLRKQKQKTQQLSSKVQEYQRDIKQLNQMINSSAAKIDEMGMKLKEYQKEQSKKYILSGRVRYLQNHTSYMAGQLKKSKEQIQNLTEKNTELCSENSSLKQQISVYLSNPLHAPQAQIYSLAKQLIQKDTAIVHHQQQLKQLKHVKLQKQHLSISIQKSNLMLEESNQEIMKQRLAQMNQKFKNIRLI